MLGIHCVPIHASSSSFAELACPRKPEHPLSSFSSTLVLPFSRNVLLSSGYVSAIGLVVATNYHLLGWRAAFFRKDGRSMAAQHDPMTKNLPTGNFPKHPPPNTDRRGTRRSKTTQLWRIRPSNPYTTHSQDLRDSTHI